jgi:amino acid adenylation domain-containing protein
VQVLFVLQNAPAAPLRLPGLELKASAVPTGTAKFELTWAMVETEQGLEGTIEYRRDLFEAPTIERLSRHFTRLLEAAVADAHRRLSELPLLSEAERRQLLGWNAAAPEAGRETTLTALWEVQVRRAPEAPAVTCGDETLTYGDLDRRANRLGRHLRRLGVGPESRVGLLLERSLEQVVGVLGILKAGGAYVPLDPSAPPQRLAYLCEDSGIAVLVTDDRPELPPVDTVIRLGDPGEGLEEDDRNLEPVVGPDNLCYVIYTSGSTGLPKGVLVRHGSVARLLSATERWFGFGAADVWTLFHSHSFDFSVWETWCALACGGRLVVVPYWVSRSPEAFWWLLAGEGVTVLNQTPSAFQQLIQADGEKTEAERAGLALRLVIFGGEALDLGSLRPWYAHHAPDAPRLVNMYGITETTVHVSYRPLDVADLAASHRSPIGVAIPDLCLRLLDAHLQLVPVGVPGEICVGGAGLARGYLGRPELTAERFVPDPFSGEPGARLYRSGDLARYRPDGELDYLGRRDQQVKVRGFRIELGEIEAALLAHGGVRSAVVLPRQDLTAGVSLVAYVEAARGAAPVAQLRELLRNRLPEYMVPAAYVLLESMPLTVNGKLDRKALAALPLEPGKAGVGEAPRTPSEELVAGIFAEVLKLEGVGPGADFFELGGHSLLATQVASRVRALFGVDLAVRAVFEAPMVAALARRIESQRAGERSAELAVIPPVPREGGLELSFAQQRLWFLDQLEPGSAVYNVPAAVELTGHLKVAVLAAALAEVVRRHEVLRTTFQAVAGEPVQVVAESAAPGLAVIDLGGLPAEEREREASRLAAAEARRPFDLGRGPLLRSALLRLGAARHVALVTMHHIVSDGWSIGVLVREVGELYAALLAGRPSPLPELAVQYADFAAWQRQRLSGELLESELFWWRRQLAGMPLALELPVDHPRASLQGSQGAVQSFTIDGEALAGLAAFSRRHGATLFMTLLAGFAGLLQRLAAGDDLVVGTPIAGRTRVEIEPLIGFFVNTLALRLDLSGEPDMVELLGRVRETTLSGYAHQEVPFERLVEELALERDLSRPPLVQVLFVVQNAPLSPLELPGLALAASFVPTAMARLELTCSLVETERGLEGSLEYRRDLFEAPTIARLAGHFTGLLAAAVADPRRPLPQLPLLPSGESQQILSEWNDTAAVYPRGLCLHELVAAQAERTPEAVAACFEDESLSYGELVRRARRLARRLAARGVGPDTRVGVLLERSLEMIVGLLGVLEAGAAYLPLEPSLPAERLALLVESAGPSVILTRERHAALVPSARVQMILLDAEEPAIENDGGGVPGEGSAVGEDHLVYVLYTSGSTGTPKGVMITHRGIVNRLLWMQEAYGLDAADRVLQKTPFGFDVSLWELFWPLLTGARLVFARPEGHRDPVYLVALIAREGITTLHFVPSMLEAFLEAPGLESLASLRRVMASGEALPPQLVQRFFARLGQAQLHNLYGPTEASVDVSFWPCEPAPAGSPVSSSVPIGRPIANHRLYVVDRWLGVQPAGVPGELLLGGPGLAHGYLGRPELTAAVFVPDPFGAEPGGRLYRTGDLVRHLVDGTVQFLGRLDHQVKIRGFRIELGEIEAALARQPGVREAVVLVREDAPGDRRLVAYVVAEAAPGPSPAQVCEALRRSLPEPMVPSAIVTLESLPLTANGKVDRRALSRIAPMAVRETASYTAPQGPGEEMLAAIWAEVLGPDRVERVGAHDDFFTLGGHSLLATQVISRVREAFGVELPVRALFEAPTVAALAARIGQEGRGAQVPPLVRVPREGDLPLSFAQQRLWFLDQLAPGNPFYNMFGAVRLTGTLEVEALRHAFREIVRRHEALRTSFPLANGRPFQAIAPAPDFQLPRIDLEALSGAVPEQYLRNELARLAGEESQRPFDLVRGPLLHVHLIRLGPREHTLLVNLHHIVSDGWSMGVLFSELATLYGAFSQGAPSPLPELPIQYADFAVWQREQLQGERLETELDYWRQQLAGIPETLELPVDHPRPAIESFRGATQPFALPATLVRELTALTRRHGATLSMTVLAGFQALLSRCVGREDIATGVAIANRTRREIEGLIGFFVNTLVVRSDLTGSPGFGRLLARVRETTLAAYAHQDLPFERLVEELQPDRALNRNPLIQVMFGYQNFPRATMDVRGLVLSPPDEGQVATGTAKFDLTLFLFEEGDRLRGSLEYNSDVFEAATIRRLLGHFETLLAAAVAEPARAVALLPLLNAAERHQLALEWNDTGSSYPAAASLQELFEAQARSTPEAPAVVLAAGAGRSELSYGELNRRANRLAHHLRGLGVGAESRVGLCLERSLELVVGLLGIVKAGGAYVPLDPDYPGERLAFMAEDSGLRVLVGEEQAVERLPQRVVEGMEVVLLGARLSEPEPGSDSAVAENPPVRTGGDGLAYVMYTSGSTGRPKGVAVPHRAVVRLVRETDYVRFGPGDRVGQAANVNFDAATWEIWGALLNGAAVVVIPRDAALSSRELAATLREQGVTSLFLTTALFNKTALEVPEAFQGLRELLFGGEAVDPAVARAVLGAGPPRRLLHVYGPTESTTYASWHPVLEVRPGAGTIPIGLPIANTSLYVLDLWQSLVPPGVAGELYIGGAGLARGYWNRPELTAERFVPSSWGRLYRTGDLVRQRADGAIEFLGRLDHQVKIRGFRIELGEIESRLAEHPAVLQSVVLAREDTPGDRRLVAYVVQDPAYGALASGVQTEQEWSELFDDIYRQEEADADPTFNIIGWNSTYTDLPLPRNEMEEWLEDTVGRILTLDPGRVLEIGCGTGMIFFRIAPRCDLYTATDVSGRALAYVESGLDRLCGPSGLGIERSRVELRRGSAEQLDGLAADSFDTVILNSVAQYFPSADYLAAVVARAVKLVRHGGAIFLGDLRSLPLLEAFHTSLELFQAEPEMPLSRLRQKVQTRRQQENELAIDPAFFAALQQRLPKISRVEVYPKRGRADNELTGFRYQVVLRIGDRADAAEIPWLPWLDWQGEGLTLGALQKLLAESAPAALGLRNVPNARVAEAVAAARLLHAAEAGIDTAGDLRRRAGESVAGAVEPQDLWDLALELPYEIELSWASPGATGSFEAVLRRREDGGDRAVAVSELIPAPQAVPLLGPLSHYTNHPLQGQFARRLAPELRAFLKEKVPEYMVPSAFVLLDALPLSHNGKVDRRRLPAPDLGRPEAGRSLVAPRNATEARLVEIWRELLGIERIGVEDDFFELGGHSLLATQAVSRVREAFAVELPLRTFFEAPSVAAMAAEVAGLPLRGGEMDAPPVVPVPRDGLLPLSFAQERLWFLHRLDTRTLAYNESAAFRIAGPLDAAALRWSLDEVLRRHESLRTTFPEVDGQAVQVIQPPAHFEIPSVDLRELPAAVQEAEAQRLALAQALRPFELARGPLVRGLLLRLGEREHAVLFSFHHVVFDGWSMGIFARELSALYGARIAGEPSPLPPLSIQYADFASWQRQWLRGEVLERQLAWWRERLAGVAVLDLATDRPRPVLPQAPSGLRLAVVPPVLTQRLRAFSRGRGLTPFMTLLAAFQALLHRYTGQDDVAVGSPIANRERGEVEGLIGFFVNMLVLRTDLSGDPGFGELLERVRQTALGAYAHQSVPFEKLVEELRPDRDLRRTPLFQVSLQLLNVPASSLELPGLAVSPFDFAARSAKFDLDLALIDGGERLEGVVDYDADLFDVATMERLLGHLERLLAGALDSPDRRLSELPLLTCAEHSQAAVEWNDTYADLGTGSRLHELFEAQVRRTPESVAVMFEGEELRYGELNVRANRLARVLRRWGVGPGVRVGLCLERSPEMVVGLLGVLKAGGAYVPLDPSYPRDRLAFMLTDARVPVLLTQERLLATLRSEKESAPAPRILCLDTAWREVEGESVENLSALGGVDELAYVIYTSGSTGRPKGAMNSHRAICNRLLWMQAADGLTGDDRVLQKTPLSFDISVWELFWPLATGARLVLARPGGHQDPDYLVRLIAAAAITTAHFVPSMLQVFLEAAAVESCTSLRRVVCSGEALTAQLERRFFSRFPAGAAPALYNLYGPTEAAVEVTAWQCEPGSPHAAVPIGRPVANTGAFVLDAHLAAVPIGIPGELYLGGVQLARGYLDRPDLTAERFIPDPFAAAESAGARLYRTGDQVRRLPGGEIVYLGRLDHQVKVRGFRIELGEVESALSSLAGVREAVVIVREDTPGDLRLVAYLTGEAAVEELRRQLRERLPEFMVPAAYVHLAALPLTPSGKVDRKALPAPDRGPAPGFVAPRTPAEEMLAEIWQDLLGRERIGSHDNFFELGGHSLLAVLLMARIEKRFGKTLSLATLFAAPTVESLAALLSQSGSQPAGRKGRSSLVAIKPQGDGVPFFCVHPIGGNVLCYLDLARHFTPEQPFYALQALEPEDEEAYPASIEEMAARYLREVRRIQPAGPYRLGGWSMGGLVAFEMARQLASEGKSPDLVALIDTLPPAVEPSPLPATEEELTAWLTRDLVGLLGHELPEDFGPAQMRPLLATFAANLQASRSFVRRPYSGNVILILSQQTFSTYGPELLDGWRRSALGGIETSTLPGDHYSLLRPPQVALLAHELTVRLADTAKRTPQLRRNSEEGSALVALEAGLRMAGSENSAMTQGTVRKTRGS